MKPEFIRTVFTQTLGLAAIEWIESRTTPTYGYSPENKWLINSFKHFTRTVEIRADYYPYYLANQLTPKSVELAYFFDQTVWQSLWSTIRCLAEGLPLDQGLYTKNRLQPDTLSFLRSLISLGKTIKPETKILLRPTTERRARIYRQLTKDLPQVIIQDVLMIEDRKNLNQ